MVEQTAIANSGQSLDKAVLTVGHLLRVLREEGLSDARLRGPIDDPDRRRMLVVAWEEIFASTPDDSSSGCTLAEAALIMGSNFHGPAEAKKFFGGRWKAKAWQRVPFDAQELTVRKNDYVLLAVPHITLQDVSVKQPKECEGLQVLTSHYRPAIREPVQPGWYLVRKEAEEDSYRLHFDQQRQLVRAPNFVADVNLAVYAWVLHYLASGEAMFSKGLVRTSSRTSNGIISLMKTDKGLQTIGWCDDGHKRGSKHGIASARRPN